MRRKDREIIDSIKINTIINSCHCCRIGFYDGNEVYIVPMNFGYESKQDKKWFYFHCAKEGRKLDILQNNNKVSFELDTHFKLNEGVTACQFSAQYQSVMGTGYLTIVEENQLKQEALQCIMNHYTNKEDWQFNEKMIDSVCILRLDIERISCKEHL